ncbi:MAG: hypothetical protein J6K72_03095, partial [Clostridia bacterium]|nr:hypothetical protein [Clostridia bacterium]
MESWIFSMLLLPGRLDNTGNPFLSNGQKMRFSFASFLLTQKKRRTPAKAIDPSKQMCFSSASLLFSEKKRINAFL